MNYLENKNKKKTFLPLVLEEAATYVLDYNTIRKQIFAAVIFFLPFVHTLTTLHLYSKNNFFSALADLYNNYMCLVFFSSL